MKRDMGLVRKILFALEARTTMKAVFVVPIDGYDETTIKYHLLLLAQARLIDFEPEMTKTGRLIRPLVLGLNWAGHEFLDAVRSETVWRKIIKYGKDKGGSLPFDLVKSVALQLLTKPVNP